MSRAIITHITLFCLQMSANFITCVMASTVLPFFPKPYCLRWNGSAPMHLSRIFLKHFSQILFMTGSMLIGRYALGRLGSFPGFLSSITLAVFQQSGILPDSVMPLNALVTSSLLRLATSFAISPGTPSAPAAFLEFILPAASTTSPSPMATLRLISPSSSGSASSRPS